MQSNPSLLRMAQKLEVAWATRIKNTDKEHLHLLDQLAQRQQIVHQVRCRLIKAQRLGLVLILPGMHRDLLAALRKVEDTAHHLQSSLGAPVLVPPNARDLLAELHQLQAEFEDFAVNAKGRWVEATTGPIALESVQLGRFVIQFFWDRLVERADVNCFAIVALDPNPAASDDRVTHPHVKDQSLCAGDASSPIRTALEQGRLVDAFCLIRGVLTHYNAASPHVALADWAGTECANCGQQVSHEDCSYCENCCKDYCSDCMGTCAGCQDSRCLPCLERCGVCGEYFCGTCLASSAEPACCQGCLQPCALCATRYPGNELSEGSHLCPNCRKAKEPKCAHLPINSPEENHASNSKSPVSAAD